MGTELILCPPKYWDTSIANNPWMADMPEELRKPDREKAMNEWQTMYSLLTQIADIVWLLPPQKGLQDSVFASNSWARIHHLPNTCVEAKFRAQGRQGEEVIASEFLQKLGYSVYQPPSFFEGEAELRHLKENIYLGGYGVRADIQSLEWIEKTFDANVIKLPEDSYLYHIDCKVFPIDEDYVIIDKTLPRKSKKEVKKYATLIEVDKDITNAGITNSIRVEWTVFNADNRIAYTSSPEDYKIEEKKNQVLTNICKELGLELVFLPLTEFLKSGALLSCCVGTLEKESWKCKPW